MNKTKDNRRLFLKALLDFAKRSGNFNPHFHRKEMMSQLGVTEGEFNIMQKCLGDKYCHFVDLHDGDDRYAINMGECLALRSHYEEQAVQKIRHRHIICLMWISVILAVVSIALAILIPKYQRGVIDHQNHENATEQ